jgi:hypothetical protein
MRLFSINEIEICDPGGIGWLKLENTPRVMSSVEPDSASMGLILIIRMKEEYLSGPKRASLSVSKAHREM